MASLAFTLQAQNIVNQWGTSGNFQIKNSGGTTEFKFTENLVHDSELHIGKTDYSIGTADAWMLDIQSNTFGPYVSFSSFTNNSLGPNLWFHKARGSGSAIVANDVIGHISFIGFDGTAWRGAASIKSKATALSNNNYVNGKILFTTANNSSTEVTRMIINSDGVVNITNLNKANSGWSGTTYAYVLVNTSGDLVATNTLPTMKIVTNEIEELKAKNESLESEIAELRKMVEQLIENAK
jgi:hypothetical protein